MMITQAAAAQSLKNEYAFDLSLHSLTTKGQYPLRTRRDIVPFTITAYFSAFQEKGKLW